MRIFISHSSADSALAGDICRDLEESGYKCFIAPRDIRSGYEYAEELVNGIDGCEVMVLLLSEHSNGSPHVLREVERAVSKNKPIIVYKLEEVSLSKSMEYFLMTHQWLERKSGKERAEIVEAIERFFNEQKAAKAAPNSEPISEKKSGKMRYLAPVLAVIAVAAVLTAFGLGARKQQAPPISSESPSTTASSAEENPVQTTVNTTAQSSSTTTTAATVKSETSAATASQPDNTVTKPPVSETEISEPVEEIISAVEIEEGESFFLGEYNGKPIEWRVIHIAEDKKSAVVISDKILAMKAFDAAEGGEYNQTESESYWTTPNEELSDELQRTLRGDNRWEYSNIRTWLNSTKEMVRYNDCPPASKAMSEHKNGYNTEAGFLSGFSKDELSAILPAEVTTNGITTEDMVFLLSSEELQWLYDADVSVYAKPTEEALEQDGSGWYNIYRDSFDTKEYVWWLRDADDATACKAHIVNISASEDVVSVQCVGLEGFGIRPAMTVDLTSKELAKLLENAE